jgi:hypothetical protein
VARLLAAAGLDDGEVARLEAKGCEGAALEPQCIETAPLPRPRRQVEPTLYASGRQTFGSRCEGRGMVSSGAFAPFSCVRVSAEHGGIIGEEKTKLNQ